MSEKMMYQKYVLKGTHYEIGCAKGASLQEHDKGVVEWMTSPLELPNETKVPELSLEEAEKRCEQLNQYDPGLGDEVKGLADGMQIPLNHLNKLLYGGMGVKKPGACSVVGISKELSADGHAYIAQSYEFGYEDEYSYIVEQAEGSYAHMGFAFYQVGRFDGINEKGLNIGITCLDFVVPSAGEKEGFSFSFLVRILLDTCATTKEALEKLKILPICTNANLIIGDRLGEIVDVEILTTEGKSDITERRAEPYVYGFNHFLAPGHKKKFPQKRNFSYMREKYMEDFFTGRKVISREDIQKFMTDKIPNGLCLHAYTSYFGTLRSMYYDITESAVYIAFGSPQDVDYVKMTLEEELSSNSICTLIPVQYEDEKVDNLLWEIV